MLVVLLKKTNYYTKTPEIENKRHNHNHDKYITTPEFNTLAANVFNARLLQGNLVTKNFFDNTVSSLDSKIIENKTKNKSIVFWCTKLFIISSNKQYFKINKKYILSWKSKGLFDENIIPYATSDNSLTPLINHYNIKVRLKFNGSCLKQPNKLKYDFRHKAKRLYCL